MASTVTVCIALFEAIYELQRNRYSVSHMLCCLAEMINVWTVPASEELSTFVTHLLYGRSLHAL